jgi:phosphoribosylformylglycinamidine synthase
MASQFPQWTFEAEWTPPEMRELLEPVLADRDDASGLLLDILARPNICSKEWIIRQYDHEVQGTSVVKPLVGKGRDVNSDAAVIRPVLDSVKGLATSQALLPTYSQIDAYHMAACSIDEAVRRVVAVGGDPERIGGVDNFCWPNIQYDPIDNPDGKYKAAQLVRANWALRDVCTAYGVPLLSGKDSMYVDGHLKGRHGETQKVSALPTLQFSCTSVISDVTRCVTMDCKFAGDLVYVLGETRNELGASEYYEHFGYVGLHVPELQPEPSMKLYRALSRAIQEELVASCHGIYRGGLGVHLALVAMGGGQGMNIDLSKVSRADAEQDYVIFYSESPGRFIVTVDPKHRSSFEAYFDMLPYACVGTVSKGPDFVINGLEGKPIIDIPVSELKAAWKRPFGGLI